MNALIDASRSMPFSPVPTIDWYAATSLMRAETVLAWCGAHAIDTTDITPAHLAAAMDVLAVDAPMDYLEVMRALRAFLAARQSPSTPDALASAAEAHGEAIRAYQLELRTLKLRRNRERS